MSAALIIGESGAGKSTSLRNLDPRKTLVLQALKKPLPFRSSEWKPYDRQTKEGSVYVTDNASDIVGAIKYAPSSGKEIIVIDDFQYVMGNEFMRRSEEKGFDKFTQIGRAAWDIANAATTAGEGVRVYLLSHLDRDDQQNIKAKTIGKMLDEKICLEGMFSIVLRCTKYEDRHVFTTQTNGKDPVKSPMGMFEDAIIDNDLQIVDQAICSYYGIRTSE